MYTDNTFFSAVSDNDLAALRLMISKNNSRDPEVLHHAVIAGMPAVVELLLNSGWMIHIDSYDDDVSFTPLIWAAYYNHMEVVRLLLARGANVNANLPSKIGNTALREVVETASLAMVQTLVNAGADPHIPGWMQLTALQKAEERVENNPTDEARAILDMLK